MKLKADRRLWWTVSVLAVLAVPAQAHEQSDGESSAEESRDDNVIIVTATRREEGIQDVPASVQVLSGETVDRINLDSFEDILPTVAGVGFARSGSGDTQIGIRGVSNITGNEFSGVDSVSPIGIYFDDTPIQGGAALPDLALYDLERVEVLKGPQGTLFGEGAMGGVIRFIPTAPNKSEFQAKGEATVSATRKGGTNYMFRGAINIPIVEDRVALRVTGSYRDEEGFIDNVATGENNVNDRETWAVRAVLDAELTDWLDVRLTYAHDETDQASLDNYNPNVGDLQAEFLEDRFNRTESDLFAGTINADLGFATLSSITSYVEDRRQLSERVDLGLEFIVNAFSGGAVTTPITSRGNFVDLPQEAFTQEIRLVSNGDNKLDWVVGGFYRDRELASTGSLVSADAPQINADTLAVFGPFAAPLLFPDRSAVDTVTPAPFLPILDRIAPEQFEQYALYGELNYEITDEFTVTVGARYFDETTSFDDQNNGFGYFTALTDNAAAVETQEDGILLKFGLDYKPTEDILIYATAAEGFRSGGGNLNGNIDLSGTIPLIYESDSLWNYEAGIKSAWLDGRLIANAAFYYLDWSNIQTTITSGFVPTLSGPRQLTFIDGGADARIYGTELELTFEASDEILMGFNLNLQDAQFTDVQPGGSILPDTDLPRAPDVNLSGFIQYSAPITDNLFGFARIDVQHTGSSLDQPLTDGSELFPSPLALRELDAFTIGRARIGVSGDNWGVDVFVDNIWDERPVVGISPFFNSFQTGDFAVTTLRPTTVGATVRFNY